MEFSLNPELLTIVGVETEILRARIAQKRSAIPPASSVFITESDSVEFICQFTAALCNGASIFLCDPKWSEADWAQISSLVGFDICSPGETLIRSDPALATEAGEIFIPTGGTSGGIKLARHSLQTLGAAVEGFCRHFQMPKVNAVGVLPLYHVSGLMGWLRVALSGGNFLPIDFKSSDERLPSVAADGRWVLSLVATQLQRLVTSASAIDWLRQFELIFLGGGPAWPELLERAVERDLTICLSYGMTETGAMVAAQRPGDIKRDRKTAGACLPHVELEIVDEKITIRAASLFSGYYPERSRDATFHTGDLGEVDAEGRLVVLGRSDDVIISGGKKISPIEVESAIRQTGLVTDVCVLGIKDAEWGSVVVALHPDSTASPLAIQSALREKLSPYKIPKHWMPVRSWPINAQGKINRAILRNHAETFLAENHHG